MFTLLKAILIPQLEGPATKIYNYVWEGVGGQGFGEIKQEKKKRLATVVSSGANLLGEKSHFK